MKLNVLIGKDLVGVLENDPLTNQFSFAYSEGWKSKNGSFCIGPWLPFERPKGISNEAQSSIVRQFFENLLPEGSGLDAVSTLHQVSKSNLVGLLQCIGQDMSGALRIEIPGVQNEQINSLREITFPEISQRIRNRRYQPFAVWDGKIRMSIAGYQDKIVVFEKDGLWNFTDGGVLASNMILKPEPSASEMTGMTGNEFICMKLAHAVGIPVAPVRMAYVPEPILVVTRFDRKTSNDGSSVDRIHVIDGCQALGISSAYKYERPYGNNSSDRDVRNIRDGASLPKLFNLLDISPNPSAQKLELLRWVIFQTLIGNTDAHAKNVSFFMDSSGLRLTPTYDLLCTSAFISQPNLDDSYAMAIGDAFTQSELTPFEWAEFSVQCGISSRLVEKEIRRLSALAIKMLPTVAALAIENKISENVVKQVTEKIALMSSRQSEVSQHINKIDAELLSDPEKIVRDHPSF